MALYTPKIGDILASPNGIALCLPLPRTPPSIVLSPGGLIKVILSWVEDDGLGHPRAIWYKVSGVYIDNEYAFLEDELCALVNRGDLVLFDRLDSQDGQAPKHNGDRLECFWCGSQTTALNTGLPGSKGRWCPKCGR